MGVDILEKIPKVIAIFMNRSFASEFVEVLLLVNQIVSMFKVGKGDLIYSPFRSNPYNLLTISFSPLPIMLRN